jgi:hypothetical protein
MAEYIGKKGAAWIEVEVSMVRAAKERPFAIGFITAFLARGRNRS